MLAWNAPGYGGTEPIADVTFPKLAARLVEDMEREGVGQPVIIGGQTRGGPSEAAEGIDRIAVEISAERFYSKTITIDHQS